MELAAQSFNNIQLLKCLHQPDYYLLCVFQKLIKHQGNGEKSDMSMWQWDIMFGAATA